LYYKIFQTYEKLISVFIASTHFEKNLLIRAGLPKDKISVKPNLVKTTCNFKHHSISKDPKGKVYYVGRLDIRKGIWTLLHAVEKVQVPLVLIGDGDLRYEVETWIREHSSLDIELTGWLNSEEVSARLKAASILVAPSEFFESFGNVIAEAFSCGVPVITTNIGAQAELVDDGQTGFQFSPGDHFELARILDRLHNDDELRKQMGKNARKEFEIKYTPDRNYQILMDIYKEVLESKQ
jgi:glycosyltransferase involved in cell wall biosynthesis